MVALRPRLFSGFCTGRSSKSKASCGGRRSSIRLRGVAPLWSRDERAGLHAVGCELLPPAALASEVKTTFELAPTALEDAEVRFVRRARRSRPAALPFLRESARQFSPSVLHSLRSLRAALPPPGDPVHNALRLAFDRILIPVSRLHRSPCLGYRRTPKEALLDPYRGAARGRRRDGGGPPPPRARTSPMGGPGGDLDDRCSPRRLAFRFGRRGRDQPSVCERNGLRDELQTRPRMAGLCAVLCRPRRPAQSAGQLRQPTAIRSGSLSRTPRSSGPVAP